MFPVEEHKHEINYNKNKTSGVIRIFKRHLNYFFSEESKGNSVKKIGELK